MPVYQRVFESLLLLLQGLELLDLYLKAQTGDGPKAGKRKSLCKNFRAGPGRHLELLKQVRTQLRATSGAPTKRAKP